MTMQHNIDIVRRNVGRNVHQSKLQSFAPMIDNQWPVVVPIAVSAHDRQRRTDRFEIERDRWLANVAQVPDLVGIAREIENVLRQLVMRVSQYKNPKHRYLTKARTQETKALTNSCFPKFLRDNWATSCEVSL